MNVGILTHHWLYNFGANLQALATQRCLQSLGCQPVIVNYRPPKLVEKYDSRVSEQQQHAHAGFRDEWLLETDICSDRQEVVEAATAAGVQTMLSGSDAVLRLDPIRNREDLSFPNPFWLDWAVGRGMRTGFLAASSMGSNYLILPAHTRAEMGQLLQQIDCIGVRDNWTRFMLSLCSRQVDINFCPDPVSVFNEVVPEELYPRPSDEDYVLISLYEDTLSPEWLRRFIEVAHAEGLKVFSLPHPECELQGPFDRVLPLPMSPLQWYAWLKHAKAYVGVRFHPIMISLVNQVPFVALDQYEGALKFRNRWLTRLAKGLAYPWRRHSSKTYDLARRAGKLDYCLNPTMYGKMTPDALFGLLRPQWDQPASTEFADRVNETFKVVLGNIVGLKQGPRDVPPLERPVPRG